MNGWPVLSLSNGVKLEVQQRVAVRSLIDLEIPHRVYGRITNRKPTIVRTGDLIQVRHYPPGRLTLVKVNRSGNVKDLKSSAVEGIDFETVPDAEPYPKP